LDISLRWKHLSPFQTIEKDEEDSAEVGFTISEEGQTVDFFVSSTQDLEKWLEILEKVMILTDVEEDYEFGAELGSGSWGSVFKAKKYGKEEFCAIKVIDKELIYS
jgi:serine/threonine protein kinase